MNYEASRLRPAFEAVSYGYLEAEVWKLKQMAQQMEGMLKGGGTPRERSIYKCVLWCLEHPSKWERIKAPLKLMRKPRGWSDENPYSVREIPIVQR